MKRKKKANLNNAVAVTVTASYPAEYMREEAAVHVAEEKARAARAVLAYMDKAASDERVNIYQLGRPRTLTEAWWLAYGEARAEVNMAEHKLSKAIEQARRLDSDNGIGLK